MEYQKDILENVNYLFNEVKNNDITELSKLLISFKEQNIFFIGIGKSNNVCLHFEKKKIVFLPPYRNVSFVSLNRCTFFSTR